MKLGILGEASQTWLILVKQALAAGHQLQCLFRHCRRLPDL